MSAIASLVIIAQSCPGAYKNNRVWVHEIGSDDANINTNRLKNRIYMNIARLTNCAGALSNVITRDE